MLLSSLASISQEQDFGWWWAFSAGHKFNTRMAMSVDEEIRLNRNASTIDLFFTQFYTFLKNFNNKTNSGNIYLKYYYFISIRST